MKNLQDKVFQMCSGHFLTERVPDNWCEMDYGEQDLFISNHMWSPLEGFDPDDIVAMIDAAAHTTLKFIETEIPT